MNKIKYKRINYQRNSIVIDEKLFIAWIHERKLIEYVLSGSVHIEIIKRLDVILKFLAKSKAMKKEYLQLMWAASEGKHEEITRSIYDTILNI